MAFSRMQTIGRLTGVAATTAPYVRRLATDDELRDDVAEFIRSANTLMTHVRSDRRLRRDVARMLETAQSGAGHLRTDIRPHHFLRNLFVGTGMFIFGVGIAIAVGWPRARRQVTRVVDQTTSRANSTVRDIRDRVSNKQGDEQAA